MANPSSNSYITNPYSRQLNQNVNLQRTLSIPPSFVQFPNNQYCAEGDTARFNAIISSPYKAKITWMHNHKSLMASSRYKSYFDGKNVCLIIAGISEFDVGIFSLIVENKDGFNSCDVELRMTGPKNIYNAPKILQRSHVNVRKHSLKPSDGIDTTSYIPSQDLIRLERSLERKEKQLEGPLVDSRPIINTRAIMELERRREIENAPKVLSGIDSKPILNPIAFKQISQQKYAKPKEPVYSEVDSNPIIKPDAFKYLEKQDNAQAQRRRSVAEDYMSVDTRPIVDPTAFRYLERQATVDSKSEPRSMVDSSHIVDPNAFRYVELPAYQTHNLNESTIDTDPIVSPEAFRFLEPSLKLKESTEPEIDSRPIVNPEAFKYIEPRQKLIRKTKNRNSVDTSSLLDQSSFKHLEERDLNLPKDTNPEIDTTSMVPLDSFKYIEPRVCQRKRVSTSPTVDTRSYVDNRPLLNFEIQRTPKDNVNAGIDDSSYVSPIAFKSLETRLTLIKQDNEPTVDSRPIISPEAFKNLDRHKVAGISDTSPEIDDQSYVDPYAIISLEHKPETKTYKEEEAGFAPKFAENLCDIESREGEDVTMSAVLSASPLPEVIWYKEGKILEKSSRMFYFINMSTKTAILSIKKVNHKDSGFYSVFAQNKYGQANTGANLYISEEPSIDDRSFVPLDGIRDLELKSTVKDFSKQSDNHFLANHTRTHAMNTKQNIEKPQFLEGLPDACVIEGKTVKMCAKVFGRPIPELTLLRESSVLQESNRIKLYYDLNSSIATITINFASIADSGIYTILAQNEKGISSSFARLNIVSDSSILQKPEIPVQLKTESDKIICLEGDDICACINLIGQPIPIISVFFCDTEIFASSRISIVSNLFEKKAYLKIKNVKLNDDGIYTIKAEQLGKTVESTFKLVVTQDDAILTNSRIPTNAFDHLIKTKTSEYISPGVDKTSYAQNPDKFKKLEEHTKKIEEESEKVELPAFESVLRPVKAIEGRQAILKIKIKARHFPEVFWLKDNLPIEFSSRISAIVDMSEKMAGLVIKSLRFWDEGMYEVKLVNKAGKVSQKAKLIVLPDTKESIDKTSYIDFGLIKDLEKEDLNKDKIIPGVDTNAFVDPNKFKYLSEGHIYKLNFKEDTSSHCAPSIIAKLPVTLLVNELNDIILNCLVEANPQPKVIWQKDGHNLVNSSRIQISHNMSTKLVLLTISNSRPIDAGIYKLTVENYLGLESCESKVEVIADINIDTQPLISSQAFLHIEQEGTKPSEITAGIDSTSYINQSAFEELEANRKQTTKQTFEYDNYIPLEIIDKQCDCNIKETENIFLYAKIAGHPLSKIEWLHNGCRLNASSRISMDVYMPNKTCWLQINSTNLTDKGIYNLIVANSSTSVNAQFYVDVLKDINIERSSFIAKEAFRQIEHIDQPKEIEAGVDVASIVDYNKFLSFENTRNLSEIDITPEVDQRSFVNIDKLNALEQKQTRLVDDESSDLTGYQPIIKEPLSDMNINEGTTMCILSAKVEGRPYPEITWMKENSKIDASSRIHSEHDQASNNVSLYISCVSLSDNGTYVMIARNCFGDVSSCCKVVVNPTSTIEEYSSISNKLQDNMKPTFSETQLKVLIANEDEDFMIELGLIGNSASLKIVMLKDLQYIQMSNRVDYAYDAVKGTFTFKLKKVTQTDDGNYVCIAQNTFGRSEKHFKLQVKLKPDSSREWITPNKEAIEALNNRKVTAIEKDSPEILKDLTIFEKLETKQICKRVDIDESIQPLRFETTLTDQVVNEFSSLVFDAIIDGQPDSIWWTLNGHDVISANRIQMTCVLKNVYLKIDDCSVNDAGIYKLHAQSKCGVIECAANLKVEQLHNESNYRDPKSYTELEQTRAKDTPDIDIKRYPIIARSMMANRINCSEGQNILLKILIQNGPPEENLWLKDNKELSQSSRFTSYYDYKNNILALAINSLLSSDKGSYAVQLKQYDNKLILLFVTELYVAESTGIDITSNISSLQQLIDLEPKEILSNTTAGVDFTNFIPMENFDILEQAVNQEKILNSEIDTTGYIPLEAFKQLEEHKIKSFAVEIPTINYNEELLAYLENDCSKDHNCIVESHDTLTNSCSVGPLKEVEVDESDDFKMSCTFSAILPYEVKWYVNNNLIEIGNRYQCECDNVNKIISLYVSSARLSDSGQYKINIVANDMSSSSSTYVHVNPSLGVDSNPIVKSIYENIIIDEIKKDQKILHTNQLKGNSIQSKPYSIKTETPIDIRKQKMIPVQIKKEIPKVSIIDELIYDSSLIEEGKSVTFSGKVSDSNGLRVIWQINKRPATGSKRFTEQVCGNVSNLIVFPVRQFDEGTIKLTVRRKNGQFDEKSCTLKVNTESYNMSAQYQRILILCAKLDGNAQDVSEITAKFNETEDQDFAKFSNQILIAQNIADHCEDDLSMKDLQFSRKIKSATIIESKSAFFSFKLNHNTPAASVIWKRENSTICQSQFAQMVFDGIFGALILNNVYGDDAASYSCNVEINGIKLMCTAQLNIHRV